MVTIKVEVQEDVMRRVEDYAERLNTTVNAMMEEFLKETADRGERAKTGRFSRRDVYRY